MLWGAIALVAAAAVVWVIVHVAGSRSQRAREARRQRYNLPATGDRVPLTDQSAKTKPGPEATESMLLTTPPSLNGEDRTVSTGDGGIDPATIDVIDDSLHAALMGEPAVTGRLVETPDGEMILTTPPFALRESILSRREAAYAAAIQAKLPRGMVLCPKVRLESLLMPTPPDGRDAEDWRTWRRRVRMRAVDLVVCEVRRGQGGGGGMRPVLAIEIDRPDISARRHGGGVDRMIDEVLGAAGLPLVRCSGDPESDWGMIEPYLAKPTAEAK